MSQKSIATSMSPAATAASSGVKPAPECVGAKTTQLHVAMMTATALHTMKHHAADHMAKRAASPEATEAHSYLHARKPDSLCQTCMPMLRWMGAVNHPWSCKHVPFL